MRIKRLPDDPKSIDKLPPDAFLGLAGHIMKRPSFITPGRSTSARSGRMSRRSPPSGMRPRQAPDELAEVEDVLRRLEAIDPRLRRVVELRGLQGLTRDEIARKPMRHGNGRARLGLQGTVSGRAAALTASRAATSGVARRRYEIHPLLALTGRASSP